MLAVFIVSYLVVLAATPVAIRVARSTGFLDRPRGFRVHAKPTPYLGGAAVFLGFLAGALVQGTVWDSHLTPLFAGAGVLWLVGTVDDRVALGPWLRVFAEVAVGILLWDAGLGWSLFPGELADLIVTVLWIVGLVNAFNLMDNLDGAAATVAAVSAAGIAFLTLSEGPAALTALAVAASGACIGFLHFNLARPARIFLGDGGSMLLGFLVAALAMAAWRENVMEGVDFLPAIMLAGLPVLDMTLVIVSRKRRGVSVGTGGRDHISHRLLAKLGSTWRVALALGARTGRALSRRDRNDELGPTGGPHRRGGELLPRGGDDRAPRVTSVSPRLPDGGEQGPRDRRDQVSGSGPRARRDVSQPSTAPHRLPEQPRLNRIRVLHVIARLNLGGAAQHASLLSGRRLDSRRFESLLVHGRLAEGEQSMADLAEQEGAETRFVSQLGQPISPVRDPLALGQLVRIVRRFKPHIVHTHTAKGGFVGRTAALALQPRPAIVHTYHGHVLEGYFGPRKAALYRGLERRMARVSDCLIGVSDRTVDDLVRLGVAPRDRFRVLPLGMGLHPFARRGRDRRT